MKDVRQLLRLYDKNDSSSMVGECHFLILDTPWWEMEGWDKEEIISCLMRSPWGDYTSYAIGDADISKGRVYWCELLSYEMQEIVIDVDEVKNLKKYKLNW